MEFRTIVDIEPSAWKIKPQDNLFLVGSCFADNLGQIFDDNHFQVKANPYGVMYNPASITHTVEKMLADNPTYSPDVAIFTLGTNHVYILNETGEIVDNCQKRPQRLFTEKELSVDECATYLNKAITMLKERNPQIKVIITVSPIRYRKYGYHGSQLSKATLLLSIQQTQAEYFPSYEIMNDELRDYRFYKEDMIHPTEQAVRYIWERFVDFAVDPKEKPALQAAAEVRQMLQHKPVFPESEAYRKFELYKNQKISELKRVYPNIRLENLR